MGILRGGGSGMFYYISWFNRTGSDCCVLNWRSSNHLYLGECSMFS